MIKIDYKQSIFNKKYRYNDETKDAFYKRVTGGNQRMEELLRNDVFVYGGRILSNRGLYKDGINVTYSNCYVLAPPTDSIEGIYDTAKRMARIYSYGGGQ